MRVASVNFVSCAFNSRYAYAKLYLNAEIPVRELLLISAFSRVDTSSWTAIINTVIIRFCRAIFIFLVYLF